MGREPHAQPRRAAPVRVRDARAEERQALEALQWRASLRNAGDRAALLAHPDAIELPQWQIDDGLVRVVERAGAVAGFSVLLPPICAACVLDGLFVEPDAMRTGLGRVLVEDAARIARVRGAASIEVIANPHAGGFYERLGFSGVESVPTRFGPGERMRLDVHGAGGAAA
jgi:GNAT superfamily N-acetyltransferase